jgi:hypothetical protein
MPLDYPPSKTSANGMMVSFHTGFLHPEGVLLIAVFSLVIRHPAVTSKYFAMNLLEEPSSAGWLVVACHILQVDSKQPCS